MEWLYHTEDCPNIEDMVKVEALRAIAEQLERIADIADAQENKKVWQGIPLKD